MTGRPTPSANHGEKPAGWRKWLSGMAVVDQAKADGSWNRLDGVEALKIPEDLRRELKSHATAAKNFDAFPRSSKRLILEWIFKTAARAAGSNPAGRASRGALP